MAASSYDECLRRLLAHEGGYSNHPADPGGPTNYGITIGEYRRYVKANATAADVKAMRLDEAKEIYRTKYWAPLRCDDLPAGVDDSVFDYGVNSGVTRAGKVLRRLLGLSDRTGDITREVLDALARRDSKAVIHAINDERLRFLRSLQTWPVFGAGWTRRVAEVRAFSLELAAHPPSGATAAAPTPQASHAPAKGVVVTSKIRKCAARAGAGALIAGLAVWIHASGASVAVVLAMPIIGAIAAAGVFYLFERRRQARQEAPAPGLVPVPENRKS